MKANRYLLWMILIAVLLADKTEPYTKIQIGLFVLFFLNGILFIIEMIRELKQ